MTRRVDSTEQRKAPTHTGEGYIYVGLRGGALLAVAGAGLASHRTASSGLQYLLSRPNSCPRILFPSPPSGWSFEHLEPMPATGLVNSLPPRDRILDTAKRPILSERSRQVSEKRNRLWRSLSEPGVRLRFESEILMDHGSS